MSMVDIDKLAENLVAACEYESYGGNDIITLNVGGKYFETAKENLLRIEGSYFNALLDKDNLKRDGLYCIIY